MLHAASNRHICWSRAIFWFEMSARLWGMRPRRGGTVVSYPCAARTAAPLTPASPTHRPVRTAYLPPAGPIPRRLSSTGGGRTRRLPQGARLPRRRLAIPYKLLDAAQDRWPRRRLRARRADPRRVKFTTPGEVHHGSAKAVRPAQSVQKRCACLVVGEPRPNIPVRCADSRG